MPVDNIEKKIFFKNSQTYFRHCTFDKVKKKIFYLLICQPQGLFFKITLASNKQIKNYILN